MKVVFLGTNGWYDTPMGNTVCLLIETEHLIILLDAGSGLYKADRYLSAEKQVHIFLSHLHLDHIIGLHQLNRFYLPQGLTIHCLKGDRQHLLDVIAPPYSMSFSALPYPVEIQEHDGENIELQGVTVTTAPMLHSVPAIGFRLILEGRSIVYCPDTGYCQSAVDLARNADVLIAECAFRIGEVSHLWPHLNPESAARIALEAAVGQLVLVHFDALRYPDIESRRQAEVFARNLFSRSSIALDGLVLEV
ncbi:MAG: ribonuclease Z [Chlorobiaceae bacterium]|nr:ribonuclease Z [Chlorobiaceae bacterium]